MKIYNKLVRDKIPEIIKASGQTPYTRIIEDDEEYMTALTDKLSEETQEVKAEPSLDELADVLEVVRAIGKKLGFSPKQIEDARVKKAASRGSFNDRIFLEKVDE